MGFKPRQCPECGVTFTPTAGRQVFCTVDHKRAFHRLMANRGQVLLPLALWAREGGRKGLEGASWARTQTDGLLSRWAIEDREAGRVPRLLVDAKVKAGWRYVDQTG